jgi:hypothetical protein
LLPILWLAAAAASATAAPQSQEGQPVVVHTPPPPVYYNRPLTTQAPTEKLQNSKIYVYSFLDVREEYYSGKVLDQLDADLVGRLGEDMISLRILRFKNSPIGETYSAAQGLGQDSTMIPVGPVIEQNQADEKAFDARYRLIIFPANFSSVGAWRYYDIRWLLIDAKTGARLWNHLYSGKHLVMWSDSENAVARSKKILDELIKSLRADGLM